MSDIFIDRYNYIYIQQKSRNVECDARFDSEDSFLAALDHIARNRDQPFNAEHPILDAQLWDGSRLSAGRPPFVSHAQATIRVYRPEILTAQDLVDFRTLTPDMLAYLQQLVIDRSNIIISGVPGSGKTTLLRVLANMVTANSRVVTIEDTLELALDLKYGYAAEVTPRLAKAALSMRDAVKKALRDKPDCLMIGEIRTPDALHTLLEAAESGFRGLLASLHAKDCTAAIERMETLLAREGLFNNERAYSTMVRRNLDVIIQCVELHTEQRRVIDQIALLKHDQICPVFVYNRETDTHDRVAP